MYLTEISRIVSKLHVGYSAVNLYMIVNQWDATFYNFLFFFAGAPPDSSPSISTTDARFNFWLLLLAQKSTVQPKSIEYQEAKLWCFLGNSH